MTTDHLGSTRVVTGQDQSVKARYDYLPFGEALGAGIGGRTISMGYDAAVGLRQKFTQKERDAESGLDYFLARYYSGPLGRFTSVDPENTGADVGDPQSWNAYHYGRNNPMVYVDPDGLAYRICDTNGDCAEFSDKHIDSTLRNRKLNPDIRLKDGKIFKGDEQTGTYRRLSDDNESREFNLLFYGREGLAARAPAMNQAIAGFAIGTAAIGAIGGAGVFYAGSLAAVVISSTPSVTGPSVAVTLLAKAQDPKLRNIINDLYRVTAKIGSGSSADAFRADGSHRIKLEGSIRGLEKLLQKPGLSQTDKDIANHLINDMKNALFSGK